MNYLQDYIHYELDVDYSKYPVINANVCMYNGQDTRINDILSDFRREIDILLTKQIFIKRNRLFFELNGIKYFVIPSCWACEWDIIEELLDNLRQIAQKVAYYPGELD